MKNLVLILVFLAILKPGYSQNPDFNASDYYWLEPTQSEEAIKWAEVQKQKSLAYFDDIPLLPHLEAWYKKAQNKIKWDYSAYVPPATDQVGDYAQLLRSNTWARMDFDAYLRKGNPDFIMNINLLDLGPKDQLVYDQIISRSDNLSHCLILYKNKGQREMVSIVEYDMSQTGKVTNGFELGAARSMVQWRDENSVYISTNLQNPREHGNKIRIWKRGEPIEQAEVIYESNRKKVRVKLIERSGELFVYEQRQAFDDYYFHLKNDELTPLKLPHDLEQMGFVSGQLVVQLNGSWQGEHQLYPAGSLISIDFDSLLAGSTDFTLISPSTKELVICKMWNTDDILIVRGLESVQSVIYEWTYENGNWKSKRIESPIGGKIEVSNTQGKANRYYLTKNDFFDVEQYVREADGTFTKYAELETAWNKEDYEVKQWFATSKDGTRVPYFIVHKKGLQMDGSSPVIMTGYGGWGYANLPRTLKYYNKWLQDDGVYVLANIRGGGEYGPDWHYSARKEKRQNAYDDFNAVAEDLIKRKVTQAGRIGSEGASNGGLLAAICFIQKPELYGAVLLKSGSIDLKPKGEEGKQNIGATGERGDPDIPENWAYMRNYSPLHNLVAAKNYPAVLLFDSRNDDISIPGHSRKFTKRMLDLGYTDVYLIETEGGGHGGIDLPNQDAIELAFFYKTIHPNYNGILANTKNNN